MSLSFPASPTVGQTYQGWVWTGSTWDPQLIGVAPIGIKTFTVNGTYTPTPGMICCLIECVGGGGGGGGVSGPATTGMQMIAGGGGGAAYARKFATAAQIGASQTVTIGAGGNGGAAGSNNGINGGTSSVGSLCSAQGGWPGGYTAPATGIGGADSPGSSGTGDIVLAGFWGGPGHFDTTTQNIQSAAGNGGGSPLGGGSTANIFTSVGANAYGYGGGGAGASSSTASSNQVGGNGSPGIVIITEYASAVQRGVSGVGQTQTLTYGTTVNWDCSLGQVATLTLGGSGCTIANPTNLWVDSFVLKVIQPASGGPYTIGSWGSLFKWPGKTAPVLSTAASAEDDFFFFYDGTKLIGSYLNNVG